MIEQGTAEKTTQWTPMVETPRESLYRKGFDGPNLSGQAVQHSVLQVHVISPNRHGRHEHS